MHILYIRILYIVGNARNHIISPLCFFLIVSGSLCEVEVNECISSPCLNEGVCVDEVNKFTCSCASGFTG